MSDTYDGRFGTLSDAALTDMKETAEIARAGFVGSSSKGVASSDALLAMVEAELKLRRGEH